MPIFRIASASRSCQGATLVGVVALACNAATDEPSVAQAQAPLSSPPAATAVTPAVAKTDPALGRVLAGPIAIDALLGKLPAETEALVGPPLSKGMMRDSCVRYVPQRTWYRCSFALQRYGDRTNAYKAITIEYQDGRSTAVAFEGPTNAAGPFDPRAALAYVGLELPGDPTHETPSPGVDTYVWFNAAARLRIDGRQHRVVVSTIENDWARTKIEVIMNDPLSADERERVMTGLVTPAGQ